MGTKTKKMNLKFFTTALLASGATAAYNQGNELESTAEYFHNSYNQMSEGRQRRFWHAIGNALRQVAGGQSKVLWVDGILGEEFSNANHTADENFKTQNKSFLLLTRTSQYLIRSL